LYSFRESRMSPVLIKTQHLFAGFFCFSSLGNSSVRFWWMIGESVGGPARLSQV
jgi:hypothetical protein